MFTSPRLEKTRHSRSLKKHHSTPLKVITDDKAMSSESDSDITGSSEFNVFADQRMALVGLTSREFGIRTIFDEHSTTVPMPFFAKLLENELGNLQ